MARPRMPRTAAGPEGAHWCLNCGRQVFTEEGHYVRYGGRYVCSHQRPCRARCLCGHLDFDHPLDRDGKCWVEGCECPFLRVYGDDV